MEGKSLVDLFLNGEPLFAYSNAAGYPRSRPGEVAGETAGMKNFPGSPVHFPEKEKGLAKWPSPFAITELRGLRQVGDLPDNVRRFLFGDYASGLRTFLSHAFLEFYRLAL